MDNKINSNILIIVIGILIGMAMIVYKSENNLNKEVLQQQSMLSMQKSSIDLMPLLEGQRDLQQKLAALETKMTAIESLVKNIDTAGAQRQGPPPEDYSKVHDIPVDHSPVIGSRDALVTIVEFSDFECPFCARFHTPMAEAVKAYPGKVNYVIKNFPLGFHKNAKPAAKAAYAAGEQGRYIEMVEALLENGKSLSEEKYKEIAATLGLDVEKFMKDYKEKDALWEEYIQKDMALGAKVGVRGTPSFYINGRKTRARDVVGYKSEIDQILEK